ncbi:energy transducer TonB [Lysobacter niastensis]|uniref:Energy transducer TonB n=1 Tax=Lysobacter niastensis TaxID=380629 RepID=A0ABS0B7E6_9GAMM|nr:energy transducer TonB [Lysobacter niastensis]MBF6023040.1 energy transducer TonB [Lysobacter niastensis]
MLLFASALAGAVEPEVVERHAELSMLVTGSIDVDADGRVKGYVLDKPDKLPLAVTELAARKIPEWTFKRPDGTSPGPLRSMMSLRFLARKVDASNYVVRIAGTSFFRHAPDEYPMSKGLKPPRYPRVAAMGGVTGIVYVVARIDRKGRVEDVIAEQVNLRVITHEAGMNEWRVMFAKVALEAAEDWRFIPPAKGPHAGDPYWSVRVPVEFMIRGKTVRPQYGEWEGYVAGPRQVAPWSRDAGKQAASVDALPAGGIYPADPELVLLNPPDQSGA